MSKERQKAKVYADKEFSLYIRARDENRCMICKRIGPVDCAHFVGRGSDATRWHEQNGNALCRQCHTEDHNGSGLYRRAMINRYGEVVVFMLERLGNAVVKLSAQEIKNLGNICKQKRIVLE